MSEIYLKIAGKRFNFFNSFNVTLDYNSVASTFSFDGLIINPEQRNIFKPLSFHDVEVLFGNDILITGYILNSSTSAENMVTLANVTGYSKTGVLEDCTMSLDQYPLQTNNLSLKEIAENILKPFGINLIVSYSGTEVAVDQSDTSFKFDVKNVGSAELASKIYPIATAEPDKTIKEYLNELAKQSNIILTHDNRGNLIFTRVRADVQPIATYLEGMPSTKISLSVNGQGMHSKISVIKQSSIDVDTTGDDSVENSLITKFRPIVKKQTSGDNDDTEQGAKNILASELRNIVLTIETDRWTWTDGKNTSIIKPNDIILVQSKSNFIRDRSKFFVEKVSYKGDNNGISATITAVLPEVYTNELPKNIFE